MHKKFRALIMLLLAIVALTACGGEEATSETTANAEIKTEVAEQKVLEPEVPVTSKIETVEKEPEAPPRDLGGLEVIVAQWSDVVEPEIKASSQEEAIWEFRHEMMEKHNFSFSQKALGLYDTLLELLSTSSMAGDPAAHMFRIHPVFALTARDSGLLYDLATLDSINLDDPQWSQTAIDQMTVGDSVYGVDVHGRPGKVIFFNKRLFEEAGMDPDYLYDLQAAGEWTWDKFMEVSAKLTRDTDNDGVNDIYAINMNHGNFGTAAIFSNNGSYMDIDENGKYYYNLPSPESMEAIEWCSEYWKTDYDLSPAHWDGHRELFYSGAVGMYLGSEWECVVLTNDKMTDDWGMVAFPKGPQADQHMAIFSYGGFVIPANFTKEEAEDIAFAYNIWHTPAPGYDEPDSWMTELYPFYRDNRAIEETMVMLRSPSIGKIDYSSAVSGNIRTSSAIDQVAWGGMSPAESVEAQAPLWQAEIDKLNGVK